MPATIKLLNPASRSARWAAASLLISGLLIALGCSSSRASGGARATTQAPAAPPAASATTSGAPKPAPLPEPKALERFDAFAALGYLPEWIGYAVVTSRQKVLFADVLGDVIAVQDTGNSLTIMESSTGANRWTLDMGSNLTKFVGNVRRDTGEIICSSQGEVFVLDAATGVLKERQKLAVITNTRPAVVGNMLVFGCPSGEVLGHNLKSGFKQWGNRIRGSITATPVRVGELVGAVSQAGDVLIVDPRTGSGIGRGEIFDGIDADPAGSDTTLFISGKDRSVWAFDQAGRRPLWRLRTESPLTFSPTYHEGRVYAAVPGDGLVCLNAADGASLWTSKGLQGSVVGVRNNRLIVWEGNGIVSAVDPKRGDVLDRVVLPNTDLLRTDALVDGNLYAVSLKGEVQKYSPRR